MGCQRAAAHVAHHDVRLPVVLAEIVHRYDGAMLQRSDDAGFPLEAGAEVRIVQEFAGQDFNGDIALEVWVVRVVDGRHATFAEWSFNPVRSGKGGFQVLKLVRVSHVSRLRAVPLASSRWLWCARSRQLEVRPATGPLPDSSAHRPGRE